MTQALRTAEAPAGPHKVVMMVGNDIAHDTRVLKMGLTLADAGLDVTLLGYASSGKRELKMFGGVKILRVPVPWRLRDAAIRRKKERGTASVAMAPAKRRALDLELNLRRREVESDANLARKRRLNAAKLQRFSGRLRAGADRRLQKYQKDGWKLADGLAHRTPYGAQWRRVLPEIDDYELAFGPVLDQLDWDVLHAHDVHLVGTASRAVARRRSQGRPAMWVYDAHEYVRGLSIYGPRTIRRRAGFLDLEREYIHDADAYVTVTEPLADQLVDDYRLTQRPAVVMNSPMLGAADMQLPRTIRDDVGLAPDVPLMVYSGGVTAVRGIGTAIEALVDLTDVHVAVVAVPHRNIPAAKVLVKQAEELGVADRVHMLDPVRPDEVASYLRSADVGILPSHHFGSHEVALANKVFEYLHAGIPLLVSDTRATVEFVNDHAVGRVHVAKDSASFVAAFRDLQHNLESLKKRIVEDPDLLTPYAWDKQEAVLRDVYRRLLGDDALIDPQHATPLEGLNEVPYVRADGPSVVGIGPANMAGQAWAWGRSLERNILGSRAEVVTVDRGGPLQYDTDLRVPTETYTKDVRWAQGFEARALDEWTHALIEAGRPLFGVRNGRDFTGDVPVLRAMGVRVGLLFHGSELRNPSENAGRTPWSPFVDPEDELTARLQRQWEVLYPLIQGFDGPKAVSTPDLLLDLPEAAWLPVVVDVERWRTDRPLLERDVPVVVHAPSRASLKGTVHAQAGVQPLIDEGLIDFRLLEGVPPQDMPGVIADADIVLDQFSIGIYGVAAAEAMASGRVVVSHVMPQVREMCPRELPIVEANPDTLTDVLRGILRDRDGARATAALGVDYVNEIHDGRRSAEVMKDIFGIRGE